MDTFEKEMARKQLAMLKSINANIAFLGKELKRTNDILEQFNGIAIMPEVEAAEEEPEKDRGNGLAPIAELKKKLADEIVEKCF